MKRILLFLLFLYSAPTVYAQTFEPGYLVLSRGDTLWGQLENAFWSDPPTEVRFRAANKDDIITYPARYLRSVGLQSGRLLRREVLPLDYGAQKELHALPNGLIVKQRLDTVLADVLIEGPATLLAVKLHDVQHFLIRRETLPYLELTERRYLAVRDGATKIVDGNNYRNQLALYFGDCPTVVAVAGKAPFTEVGMAQVVQAYNQQCSRARQAGREWLLPAKGRDKIAVQVGPMLGVRYNAMRLHLQSSAGLSLAILDGVDLYGRLHGQGGFYVDVLAPGRRLALHSALLYSRYGRRSHIKDLVSGTQATLDTRGSVATLYAGLRGFRHWSAYRLLVGTGVELHYYWNDAQAIHYYYNDQLVRRDHLFTGFAPGLLPYVEAGIQRGRLSLTLNVRRYGKEAISEGLNDYRGRTWSTALALAYNLNGG